MIASNRRILVVEDDAGTSRLFDEILRHLGMHIDFVVDGVEALEYIRNEPPDLVILDIALPRLDGWDVLDAMRKGEMAPDVPVVVITAHGQGMSAERAMDKGAQRFFEKPFIPSEVVAAVAELLPAVVAADPSDE